MASHQTSPRVRGAISIAGGLLFAGSLAFFADSYGRRFAAMAPADSGVVGPLAVNLALFAGFALHHSVFARAGIKTALMRVLPPELERSCYVWLASLLFVAVCAFWRPLPGALWSTSGWGAGVLRAAQFAAAIFTLFAARHLDILELAGIRQAFGWHRRHETGLDAHGPYGLVRHPIYLAWVVMVWASPVMTSTHLAFAAMSTAYLLAAIPLEERDLRRTLGPAYDAYAGRVRRKLIPGIY